MPLHNSPSMWVSETLKAAWNAFVGFSLITFVCFPLAIWRTLTQDVEQRLKVKKDTLQALTDEALEEIKSKCDDKFKKTIKSINIDHDITQHCVIGGDPHASTNLLHGFPECWYEWHEVIPQLVNNGYFVVAPDMRGYGLSSAPVGKASYAGVHLINDLREVIAYTKTSIANNIQCTTVVGHDWGGTVTFAAGLSKPPFFDSLVCINGLHPLTYGKCLAAVPYQLLKSWYILYWQIPYLVEFINKSVPFLSWITKSYSNFGFKYLEAAHAGNVGPMVNYYRAAISAALNETLSDFKKYGPSGNPRGSDKPEGVRVPVLMLFGMKDDVLDSVVAQILDENRSRYVPNGFELVCLPSASHWVPTEEPLLVADRVAKFAQKIAAQKRHEVPRVEDDNPSQMLGRAQGQHGIVETASGELEMIT